MSTVTDYLRSMEGDVTTPDMWTKEQAEAWANDYWRICRDTTVSKEEANARLTDHQNRVRPIRDVRTNERGNQVIHRHRSTERYLFDFDEDFFSDGWLQCDTDQDAWYYGVWVNPKTLRTLTYAEGDVYLAICPDAEHYNAEIKRMCEFHGEGFEFIACDGEAATSLLLGGDAKGEATVCRQDRSMFFVKV